MLLQFYVHPFPRRQNRRTVLLGAAASPWPRPASVRPGSVSRPLDRSRWGHRPRANNPTRGQHAANTRPVRREHILKPPFHPHGQFLRSAGVPTPNSVRVLLLDRGDVGALALGVATCGDQNPRVNGKIPKVTVVDSLSLSQMLVFKTGTTPNQLAI